IAGSGYVVGQGDFKVAIDGLTSLETPAATQAMLAAAQSPFDVNLILVTHSDPDHFNASLIASNMAASPRAALIGPANVVRAVLVQAPTLDPARLIVVHPGLYNPQTVEVAGLSIDVFSFPLPGPENVGYRFRVGDLVFVDPGDLNFDTVTSDFVRTGLIQAGISRETTDVLILPYFLFNAEYRAVIPMCPARLYVPTHAQLNSLSHACETARNVTANVLCFSHSLEEQVIPALGD
ncbi:MAG: MBL fold metallo-hydrolase, partial [Candidatus Bipolaricaulota bacterium]|nr:MBL fold metallo-hydrolase [Candidatus Bipolaricaulota bacterium]